jgi:hypothetical protein
VKPWAFESREFLRAFAVGKEISFTSTHSLPTNDDVPRDIGSAEIAGLDLATELLKNGWVKVKDLKREPTEDDIKRKEIESEAKSNGKGMWNSHGPPVCYKFQPFRAVLVLMNGRRVPSITICLRIRRPSWHNGEASRLMVPVPVIPFPLVGN